MICFAMTRSKMVTHERLLRLPEVPDVRLWSYDRIFAAHSLPRATWVFTDMDRLGFWDLELAALAYRLLETAGVKCLNDPARACQRASLLRRLRGAGLNRFGVWRVADGEWPDAWPVFLRTDSGHRGPLGDLLHDRAELEAAIDRAIDAGHPSRELLIVEYCAQPIRDGLFHKRAVFRVGETMVPTLGVFDELWSAKRGKLGVAGLALYEAELAELRENRFGEPLRPAFELGAIGYGRADFALVDGTPQVYEINTNPTIGRIREHPHPPRMEAARHCERRFAEALHGIDSPRGGKSVALDTRPFDKQRRKDSRLGTAHWTP